MSLNKVFPLLPISIILGIDWKLYKHPSKLWVALLYLYLKKLFLYFNLTNKSCWLSGFSMTFGIILPILIIVIINIFIFALIMRKHCVTVRLNSKQNISSTKSKDTNLRRQTVILSTCFINMGLTWSFGFFLVLPFDEYTKTVFSFLFCFFNSLQGFLIFSIYIVLSKSRRKYIKFAAAEKFRKLKKSLYTNDETGSRDKSEKRNDHFDSKSTESEFY